MPTLVNFSGDDNLHPRGPLYCPLRKRARVFYSREKNQKQQQPQPCSLDNLPDECLYEILRRLPGNRERSNSACVSKRWLMLLSSISPSEISLNHRPSSKPCLPDLNSDAPANDDHEQIVGCLTRSLEGQEVTDVRLAAVAVGTAGHGGLGKLLIRGSHPTCGLTDLGMSAVARCCPSIKVLSMWNVPSVGDHGLAELAAGCPMLEKLDLCECPMISDKGLLAVAEKCPNLMSLTLDSCAKVGNEGLAAVGRMCPRLQSVSIKDCPLVSDHGIASMMCSISSSLVKVKLESLNISDWALACVGHYGKAITELHLNSLQNVGERGFWVMGNAKGLQKLKTVTVTFCRGVTDPALEALAKGCPSLKQVLLRRCCHLSDAGLKAFVQSARSLQSLQLEECNLITLIGVLSGLLCSSGMLKSLALVKCPAIKDISSCPKTLPFCKSLQSLTIRDCPGFTSSSLALVGKICPNLDSLDLSGLIGVTDDGLLPIIESSEQGLTKVSLRGCSDLTDSAISSLVKLHGDTLLALNLEGCNKVTDKILMAISEHCTVLEELDLTRANITDYGVALLASARHLNISILSLAGCSKLTPRSLPLLGNMGPTLVGLNLQQCNLISASCIASLEEKMWWCDILS